MGVLLAFAVGYVVGARAGTEDFRDLVDAYNAVRGSDEFTDFMQALRGHAAFALRELAAMVDGDGARPGLAQGLVERVRSQDVVERVRELVKNSPLG